MAPVKKKRETPGKRSSTRPTTTTTILHKRETSHQIEIVIQMPVPVILGLFLWQSLREKCCGQHEGLASSLRHSRKRTPVCKRYQFVSVTAGNNPINALSRNISPIHPHLLLKKKTHFPLLLPTQSSFGVVKITCRRGQGSTTRGPKSGTAAQKRISQICDGAVGRSFQAASPPFCIDKHHQHKTWKRTLKSTWFSTFNHTTTLRRHSARRFRQCQLVIHKKRFRFFGRKSLETGASHKDKHTTHDLPRLTSLPRMPRSCSFAQLPTKVVRLRLQADSGPMARNPCFKTPPRVLAKEPPFHPVHYF